MYMYTDHECSFVKISGYKNVFINLQTNKNLTQSFFCLLQLKLWVESISYRAVVFRLSKNGYIPPKPVADD